MKSVSNNFKIINVLPPEYYRDCHIKNSINIPFDRIEDESKNWDKNIEIIIYCARYECTASKYAFQKLKKMGFKNIAIYEGGVQEWFQKEYPTEGPCSHKILREKSSELKEEPITRISAETLLQKMKDHHLL